MPDTLTKLSKQAGGHPRLAFRAKQLLVSPTHICDFHMPHLSLQSEAESESPAPQLETLGAFK